MARLTLSLAWFRAFPLQYTDDEVERYFEEFYEDVHTEFLKFGEIVNFKVILKLWECISFQRYYEMK